MITWNAAERVLCILLGFIHVALGFATAVGGRERFPAPGYTPLLELSHGVVWPYGATWAIGGLLMLVFNDSWPRLVGIALVVFISNLWAALFLVAAYDDSAAPLTPVAAYGGYGLLNAVLAALIVMHARWEDGAD